jgi:hypothetical protein
MGLPHDFHSPFRADVVAGAATGAKVRVNTMGLLFHAPDGAHRTLAQAKAAAGTAFRDDLKPYQGATDPCRAASFAHMGVIFIPEITERG